MIYSFFYIIILLTVALTTYLFAQNSQEKLYNNINSIGSASQRYYDTLGALKVISDNPILCIGIDHAVVFKEIKELFGRLSGSDRWCIIDVCYSSNSIWGGEAIFSDSK